MFNFYPCNEIYSIYFGYQNILLIIDKHCKNIIEYTKKYTNLEKNIWKLDNKNKQIYTMGINNKKLLLQELLLEHP